MISMATNASTGHLAIDQTVTAVSPTPSWSPIDSASGPLTASSTRASASIRIARTVISTCRGRSFQTGRPSPTSYTLFIARPNAPM